MLRTLLRILVVVLLVHHLEARLSAPSLLDSVKSAASKVASAVSTAATKVFGVTSRAKFNGAAGRLKDTDQSCVMCQYYVQRIQGYSILYAASNPGVSAMLEESSELTHEGHEHYGVSGVSPKAHHRPQEMTDEDYSVYLEIIKQLHDQGTQEVEKKESKREAHAQKHFEKDGKDWVSPEYDEGTSGKQQVLTNELPGSNMHAEDLDNSDGKGNVEPDEVPAEDKNEQLNTAAAAAAAPPAPAFKEQTKTEDKATDKADAQADDSEDEDDEDEDEDEDSDSSDKTAAAAAASANEEDNADTESGAKESDDKDEDSDSDDNKDSEDSSSSLLETSSRVRTRQRSKAKSKARARKTKYTGLGGYSGRYRVADQKLYRPVPARYSPVHPYLPNAASEAQRMRLNQMYQLVYASFQTICTLRQPFEMAGFCGELESRYRTVAEGLRYGDRPDEICMEIDMCDKDAYIRSVAHATPPPPTSPSAWIPIASNILLNYPEDQALSNLKLALVDFNAAQTASILLQAGMIATNQDDDAMAESIRLLGKFSGQKPANWVKEKAYQIWVLATIVAKGSSPSASAVQQAAATQANTYLQSSQDNSGAIQRLVTRFASDGYTAARSANNDVVQQFASLITDQ